VSDLGKGSAPLQRRPPRDGVMTADDWESLRREVIETFTPGTPINEADLFTGRAETLRELQDTILEKGRHAIIFGDRGVGKTSVANIFYKPINTPTRPIYAIRVNGDSSTDFDSLWRKVFRRIKHTTDGQAWWLDEAHPNKITPDDVVIELGNFLPLQVPIIILDEFDKIGDQSCRTLVAETIKALSDDTVNCTIIIVGVATSVSDLIKGHASIPRGLKQVAMLPMAKAEIEDLVTTRIKRLRMRISSSALWRIGFFSAGLPFYAHSLGKHAALAAVADGARGVEEKHVLQAMRACMSDVDYSVRESYAKATQKSYRQGNIYPQVLAAAALTERDAIGRFGAADCSAPLSAIMGSPYKTTAFSFHLKEMAESGRGEVLDRYEHKRTFRFSFRDPFMQPYIIMQSLASGFLADDILQQFSVQFQRRLSI
jgi:Cdc6-like AAA superfamily ATPase